MFSTRPRTSLSPPRSSRCCAATLATPPDGWPRALLECVLGGSAPITVRSASLLGEQDLAASRAEAEVLCERKLSDAEFASYLMYPKVFTAYAGARRRFGPVSALPTPIFFYGMQLGEEANIMIEQGKTLVIQLTAVGEVEDDGMVRLFFELNGQPRVIAVVDHRHGKSQSTRRLADPGDDNQIAAPMPGLVSACRAAGPEGRCRRAAHDAGSDEDGDRDPSSAGRCRSRTGGSGWTASGCQGLTADSGLISA